METKWFARAGAGLFVAIVVTVSAIEMGGAAHQVAPSERRIAVRPDSDPLRGELLRCQSIGQAGASDPACLRAWAENRRRFLAPGARPAGRLPEPIDQPDNGLGDARAGAARAVATSNAAEGF